MKFLIMTEIVLLSICFVVGLLGPNADSRSRVPKFFQFTAGPHRGWCLGSSALNILFMAILGLAYEHNEYGLILISVIFAFVYSLLLLMLSAVAKLSLKENPNDPDFTPVCIWYNGISGGYFFLKSVVIACCLVYLKIHGS
ncbi:MAG TPA: hypothetical protein VEA59_07400 [Patescibacteria group bacterium]|nr:hypothetical protein [Patescibacteria group bacterium]